LKGELITEYYFKYRTHYLRFIKEPIIDKGCKDGCLRNRLQSGKQETVNPDL